MEKRARERRRQTTKGVTKKRKRTAEREKDTEIRGKDSKHGHKEGGGYEDVTANTSRREMESNNRVRRGRTARKRRGRQIEEEERTNTTARKGRPKRAE
jgi:hypothetical protein